MNINNTNRWYGKKAGIEKTLNSWSTIMNAVDHNSPDRLAIDKIIKTLNIKSNGDDHPFIKNNDRVLDSLSKQSNEALLTILTTFNPSGDGDDFNKLVILYAEFQDRVSGNKTVKEFEAQFVQKVHDAMRSDNNQMTNETTLHHKNIGLTASKNDGFFIRKKRAEYAEYVISIGIKIPPGRSRCYFEGVFKGSHPISGFIRSLDQNNLSERRVCFDGFNSTISIIRYSDGSEYTGTIQNLQPHGSGQIIKITDDGRITLKGEFDQGQLLNGSGFLSYNNASTLIQIRGNFNDDTIKRISVSEAFIPHDLTHDDIDKIAFSLLENPMPEYILVSQTAGDGVTCTIYPTEEFMKGMKTTGGRHPDTKRIDFDIIYPTKYEIEKLRQFLNGTNN